jgi:AcrR family transcriptional regulator
MTRAASAKEKKLEIIEWAYHRFYDGGFHALGIDELMESSGISKRTLYKYFPSKELLIAAVLDHYVVGIMRDLFDPATNASKDPGSAILSLFDIRKRMIEDHPARGCLGVRASLEYAGKHAGIEKQGGNAPIGVEQQFVELCRKAGAPRPLDLGKQINIIFQGAVLVSQVLGESSPFVAARAAVVTLLKESGVTYGKGSR